MLPILNRVYPTLTIARQSFRPSKSARTLYARNMATQQRKHKVTVVGSGNWGSAIAKIVAENTASYPDLFERDVQMWVFEEQVTIPKESKHYTTNDSNPQPLTTLINRIHENVKYLPGIALPTNLIANPSVEDSVKDASILIFNLPHQFIARVCGQLQGKILPSARGVSCIKGVDVSSNAIHLFSDSISHKLGIYCGALSGANIANEVALEKWSETTIAYDPPTMDSSADRAASRPYTTISGDSVTLHPVPTLYPSLDGPTIAKLFHRPYFHVRIVKDVVGVSLGGALKNIVALAAGFVEGLGWGDNAKAAVMRVGILEQVKFGQTFFPNHFTPATLTEESCGVADMITSCSGGRNFRCAKMSVQKGLSIEEVEKTELNGQKLQGTSTSFEVNAFLRAKGMEKDFPLLTAVCHILQGSKKPEDIPQLIEPKSSRM